MHGHICECIHMRVLTFMSVCLRFYNGISLFTKSGCTKSSMTLNIRRISHTPFHVSRTCFTSFFLNGSIIFHRRVYTIISSTSFLLLHIYVFSFFFFLLLHICCVHVGALFSAGYLKVELLLMAFVLKSFLTFSPQLCFMMPYTY